jgi:hypothetical protein
MWHLPKYMLVNKIKESENNYLKYKVLYETGMHQPWLQSPNQLKYYKTMMILHYNKTYKLRVELIRLNRLRKY